MSEYIPVPSSEIKVKCDRCGRILDKLFGHQQTGLDPHCRQGLRQHLGHARDVGKHDFSDYRRWRYRCQCGVDIPVLVDKLDRAFREAVGRGVGSFSVPGGLPRD